MEWKKKCKQRVKRSSRSASAVECRNIIVCVLTEVLRSVNAFAYGECKETFDIAHKFEPRRNPLLPSPKCDKFNSIGGGVHAVQKKPDGIFFSNANVPSHEKAIKMTTTMVEWFFYEKFKANGYSRSVRCAHESEARSNVINYVTRRGRMAKGTWNCYFILNSFMYPVMPSHKGRRPKNCVSLRLCEFIVEMIFIRSIKKRGWWWRWRGWGECRCQNDITWCFPSCHK